MDPLRRIYSRIYQTAFHIALPLLPYRNPKIVKRLQLLPEVIRKESCHAVLIITDAGVRKHGLIAPSSKH